MAQSDDNTQDKCTNHDLIKNVVYGEKWVRRPALSSGQESMALALSQDKYITSVVLLCGTPPAPSTSSSNDLLEFGSYIHALAVWTTEARAALFKLWGIDEEQFEQSVMHRYAFDVCLQKWYTLAREEDEDEDGNDAQEST